MLTSYTGEEETGCFLGWVGAVAVAVCRAGLFKDGRGRGSVSWELCWEGSVNLRQSVRAAFSIRAGGSV